MQQGGAQTHQKLVKFTRFPKLASLVLLFVAAALATGCNIVKKNSSTPTLLKTEDASLEQLTAEVNRFARVNSIRAKMDLKFEDDSFAQFGNKEIYRSADGEVVVQRPGKIRLKVQLPIIKSDVAQMTSDGQTFRVAVLQDNAGGKYKKFVKGTNDADYTKLQKNLESISADNDSSKASVNSFSNIRPQHFTDALLVRPTDPSLLYLQSAIYQVEEDDTQKSKSPLRKVMRGYYLLDELSKQSDGGLKVLRRFWFDRVGGIRLARQQIFDARGEIESDITYGRQGTLTAGTDYTNLPLMIRVTRPKEKYTMSLTYQSPEAVTIGSKYPEAAFALQNTWGLEEIDLDQKLREASAAAAPPNANSNSAFHLQ
jgi:hypothetical protein